MIKWASRRMRAIFRVANMANSHNLQDHAALKRIVNIIETKEEDASDLEKLCRLPKSWRPRTSLGGCTTRLCAA